VETAYDPARIRDLSRRTVVSIESLTALRSTDQATADALRAIRLTRQNLENQWMPLLREIENSRAMVSWLTIALDTVQASGARFADWFVHHSADGGDMEWTEYTEKTDQEVLDWLAYESEIPFPWDERFGRTNTALNGFSEDLANRVNADADFATSLIALAPTTPIIALATGEADFPDRFTAGVVSAMLSSAPWVSGLGAQSKAEAVQVAMAALRDNAGAVLDVLTNPDALFTLANWSLLDTKEVQEFTTAGLYEAVLDDATRLADGYEVLAELTRLTNGRLDDGMQPGLARGVAISMDAYLETLAPALVKEGSNPVLVVVSDQDDIVELGSYSDVTDLFGALMRDAPAQAALGGSLGRYTNEMVYDLGENIIKHQGLNRVSQFADLLGDAARAEQAELVMAAAAEAASRRQVGSAVRTGVNVGLSLSSAGIVARSVTNEAMKVATDWATQVRPDELIDLSIPSETYDLITVAAIAMVADNPSVRSALGLNTIPAQSWGKIDDLLDDIENSDNSSERARKIVLLDRYIEDDEPDLGGYMSEVRDTAGVDELIEQREAVGTD